MSSSVVIRFNITIAGSPIAFAQPFATPFLTLEEPPAVYDVQVPAAGSAVLWHGAPLPDDFDILALTSDQSCDVDFSVDDNFDALFTLFLRAGGYPLILDGSDTQIIVGVNAAAGTTITNIRARNRNADTVANVSVLLGKKVA